MKVLVACEFSGIVRDAFLRHGHDAWSCDLIDPATIPKDVLDIPRSDRHFVGDVRSILNKHWDMVIAHPPCTYITNTAVQWLSHPEDTDLPYEWRRWHPNWPTRRDDLVLACQFFRLFLDLHHVKRVVVENPIPHRYAIDLIGRKYDQKVQPYQFGHKEKKATCFWLKGVLKLVSTDDVELAMLNLPKSESQKTFYMSNSPYRDLLRSLTFRGLAEAMATQWGSK